MALEMGQTARCLRPLRTLSTPRPADVARNLAEGTE